MIAAQTRRSLLLGVTGVLLQVGGVLLHELHGSKPLVPGETRVVIGPWLATVGVLFWTAGLAFYAMAKGQSSWWGVTGLLGLPGLYEPYLTALSLFGLVILAVLPDRTAGPPGPGAGGPPGAGTW
jgi:hypothetical protein